MIFLAHEYGQGNNGGNRTRIPIDTTTNGDNELCKRPNCLAALWLHSPDADKHELARIGRIIEAWPTLPDHIKLVLEAFQEK